MNIVIIDGQGGQLGAQLVREISVKFPDARLTAIGTNVAATSAMIKAGAKNAATGENAVVVACRKADVVVGPVGIVIADSLLGEITPKMAVAVGQADAKRILIPMDRCNNIVAGLGDCSVPALIRDAVANIGEIIG